MVNITVGQISAAINAGIIILQITLPLAVVLILAGVLKNRNNAVTWSVVDRMLQGSLWPAILSSDSAATVGVHKRVATLASISTLGTMLLLVAGIVTPLGLSEQVQHTQLKNPEFQYVPDLSWFGRGTPPRAEYTFSRLCGSLMQLSCPGQTNTNGLKTWRNATDFIVDTGNYTGWIDSRIPRNITEIFTSADGQYGSGVVNPFEIQYRNYEIRTYKDSNRTNIDNGAPLTVAQVKFLESFVLNNRYDIVEGLIVDTINGGVGFRNHTIPVDTSLGVTWNETLLWMEPSTVCVNNNLTIDYTITEDGTYVGGGDLSNMTLTDRGGFMDTFMNKAPSSINRDASQTEPELYHRSWNGAAYSNMLYASFFNVTTRNVTRKYGTTYALDAARLGLPNEYFSLFYDLLPTTPGGSIRMAKLPSLDGYNAGTSCKGFGGADDANITNISIGCGRILGAARRTDSRANDRGFMFEPGSTWSHPIYSCATSIKATLKRVTFFANRTMDLESLEVVAIDEIKYTGNTSKPLWAVEKTGMAISDVSPLWGLVDERYENHENLWTVRSSHLYLPAGTMDEFSPALGSLASAGSYQAGLGVPYAESYEQAFDYTGKTSYAMTTRWNNLSKSAESISIIPNLIWTDVMANAIMGTRSINTHNILDAEAGENLEIEVFRRAITYSYVYAIPAFILFGLWFVLCLSAFILWVSARVTLPALRQLLNQTGTGRAVTNIVYPDKEISTASTHHWVRTSGKKILGLMSQDENTGLSFSPMTEKDGRTDPSGQHFTSEPENDQLKGLLNARR